MQVEVRMQVEVIPEGHEPSALLSLLLMSTHYYSLLLMSPYLSGARKLMRGARSALALQQAHERCNKPHAPDLRDMCLARLPAMQLAEEIG